MYIVFLSERSTISSLRGLYKSILWLSVTIAKMASIITVLPGADPGFLFHKYKGVVVRFADFI